ncbi:MAG: hypothetical protein AAGL10_06680 [Pseudomonadota bacterium]
MVAQSHADPLTWPVAAWASVVLAGVAAPVIALLMIAAGPDRASFDPAISPTLALGLMGSGMIGAAAARHLWAGLGLALMVGLGLSGLAWAIGLPVMANPLAIALTFVIASFSFAARGFLFSRSGGSKGWGIAIFVVGGEAAILLTAMAQPGLLPDWLLALLPAQWANMAIAAALSGAGLGKVVWAVIALLGTALATLFVARLWPKRWTYSVMFTTWIAMSALVYYQPAFSPG